MRPNYYGITYTVNTKGDCTFHVATPAGAPLCGSKASEDFQHTAEPAIGDAPVNCGNCLRMLDARIRRASAGQSPLETHWHWRIDGELACSRQAEHCLPCAGAYPATVEAYAVKYLARHPGADVTIVEGPCPGSLAAVADDLGVRP